MEIWVGGFEEEGLTEAVKGGAPWVGNGEAGRAFKVVALGGIAKEAAIRASNRSIGSFYVTVKKCALTHVKRSRRVCAEGANYMVGIMIIEAAHHDRPDISTIVAITIAQVNEMGSLGNINAVVREFEACG